MHLDTARKQMLTSWGCATIINCDQDNAVFLTPNEVHIFQNNVALLGEGLRKTAFEQKSAILGYCVSKTAIGIFNNPPPSNEKRLAWYDLA